jgi:capsular exopolysaccharide synthesis family protein
MPAAYTEVPYTKGPVPSPEFDTGGLIDYWRILGRRKGTLILLATVGGLIGFLVTLPQTPVYQAKTSIEIMGVNQNFLNVREASPITDGSTSPDIVDLQTQVRVLQSESLVERTTKRMAATTLPEAEVTRISAWRKLLNLPESDPDGQKELFPYERRNIKIRGVPQTRIIEISVDSATPDVAASFANTLTNEFIDQTLEARLKTTERTGQFLSRQIDDARARLEQSEDRLQQYANKAGLVFTSEKTNISEERLSQAQLALSTAQADRILKQSRWEIANASSPESLPDVLNDLTLREYQSKLTELNRQLAELRQTYTPESSQVRKVVAQIAPLEKAFSGQTSDILKRIRNDYEEAQQRETLLQDEYLSQRRVVTGEGEKSIQYNILKREVESNRQLYDTMLQQLKQAGLASTLQASNIRIVDSASVPKKPVRPDVPLVSGLGILCGLFFGAAFVITRESMDRSIRDPGETAQYVNLPELGIIPVDNFGRARGRITSPVPAALATGTQRTELALLQRRKSAVAQSVRATLVSIVFSGKNGARPRVMVISSANPAEGKTTVVSNLGIALAEVNHKVLLIDADLHKPHLHDVFDMTNDRGLSDVLLATDFAAELGKGVIRESGVPGLHVLTSGAMTSAATTLLYSTRMPELLTKLREQFETIFIDTPPVLQIPDARMLGRLADRTILVVRAGVTTRDAIAAACRRFSEDGTEVLGTVLNYWNPKHSSYGYYGYYSRNNGYYNRSYYGTDGRS